MATRLQYSCLEKPRDRGAWPATIHVVAKSLKRLSTQGYFREVSSLRWQMFWTPGSKINPGENSFLCFLQIDNELLCSQSQYIYLNFNLLTLQGHPSSKLLNNAYLQVRAVCTVSDSGLTMPKQRSTGGYTFKKKSVFFSHKRENQARNLLNVQKAVSFSIYKSQETWRSSIMHPLLFLISRGSCNCPSVVTSHLYSQFWGHPLDLWMIPLYCLCACTRSEGRMVSSEGITLCSVTGFLQPRSSVPILLFRLLWDS